MATSAIPQQPLPRIKRRQATLTHINDKNRIPVYVKTPKTENILFVGSEMQYNNFWLKMMFIGAAFAGAQKLRPADKQTLAYVDVGYVRSEKLALEHLKDKTGFELVKLSSSQELIQLLNRDRENFKLLDVMFFCHGVPMRIDLNFKESPIVQLDNENLTQINPRAFAKNGALYSYACRTGVSRKSENFKTEADAQPENSLAQKLADHLGIAVHAFLRRSFYGHILRKPEQSDSISQALREKRQTQEGQTIDLSLEHEALFHPGLADSW